MHRSFNSNDCAALVVQSTLIYRLPGSPVVEKKGRFSRLDDPGAFEGFIVSDFEGNHLYGFYEGASGEEFAAIEPPVVISKSEYCDMANEFIHYLQDHSIDKAILSRVKQVDFTSNLPTFFAKLVEKYPNAFCYYFESPSLGTWIGATPETLVKIEAGRGATMSLAGTKPVADTTDWGVKEMYEQQLVTDFIRRQLIETCKHVHESEREELMAGPVKHLVHYFTFEIAASVRWELIRKLHPTPAVSGFPREKALECIAGFEAHDRKFYAGIIGLTGLNSTRLFVNLRSAQLLQDQLYLYVGGGLTQQSDPIAEWDETENKAKTLLNLID